PERKEICPSPIGRARELVKRADGRAWRWDALEQQWSVIREDSVFPGLVIWIDSAVGGYETAKGFDLYSKSPVQPLEPTDAFAPEALSDNRESFTSKVRISLTRHTEHVHAEMMAVANALGLAKADCDLLEPVQIIVVRMFNTRSMVS